MLLTVSDKIIDEIKAFGYPSLEVSVCPSNNKMKC